MGNFTMSYFMKKKGGILVNRASVDSSSINKDEKTFDVVFATENPIQRSPYWADETFLEVLVVDKKSIRSMRLDSGVVPLLDTHNSYGINNQFGIVRSWSIKNGEARATIQFSNQESKADIWRDIESGIIRSISVGAKVYQYQRVPDASDPKKMPTYRAVDWEPQEISLAPVPMDYMSSVRSEDGKEEYEIFINDTTKRSVMNAEEIKAQQEAERKRAKDIRTSVRAAGLDETFADDLVERGVTVEDAAKEIAAKKAAPATLTQEDINRAVEAEATRANDIRLVVRSMKLPEAFADELISKKVNNKPLTLDMARAEIINKMAATDNGPAGSTGQPSAKGSERSGMISAMVEGMMHRAQPGSVERYYNLDESTKGRKMDVAAHDFKHMRFIDLTRAILEANGVPGTKSMSAGELVSRALDTTDLPDLFTSTVKRFLRMYYEPIVPEWMQFSRNVPADDFRVKTGVKFDAAVTFEELNENGEYKEANMLSDEKATLQLQTFARRFSITRQAIINDDLGVLTRMPQVIGIGAKQFQSKKVWGLITSNVNAPDGNALFSAAHGNYGTGISASAINDAALSAARTAMRRQKSPQGNELLITPKFLLVPPELETTAQKFLRPISPTKVADVNLWQSLEPFVNVYFADAKAWYMFADPGTTTTDGIVHSYLTGQEGLFTESYIEKKSDKLVIKARLDFAAAIWGWQGLYNNDGAARAD